MGTNLPRFELETRESKHTRYNKSEKGQKRDQRRNTTRNERSLERYLNREFVAWDGEGLNEPDGTHTYVLLASSSGARLISRTGLSTSDVLDLWLEQSRDPIHVGYGLGYDINMVLKDLNEDELRTLYKTGNLRWRGYRLDWRIGKSFSVRQGKRSFLIYDCLPFFQRSFVAACDEFLGDDWFMRDTIIREKAKRGSFTFEEITSITEYNDAELVNLVHLVFELRERLHKVDLRIRRWDGPGAIATAIYTKHGTKQAISAAPPAVESAVRHGYAGGRFEIVRKGHSSYPAWQYDIRSAYPSAMRFLPCLAHGQWRHVERPTRLVPFGVYRVEVDDPIHHMTRPQPLWMRNKNGTVFFDEFPHGWYWTPEVENAIEYAGGHTIQEGWEFHPECDHEPFSFVGPMYNKRAALKRSGDGAQLALKLGINSLYGKLAQQVGWSPGPPLKLPPYHCLEWAGFITSHCRAQVYRAAMQAPDDVIAFETDAVFTRVPLDLPCSDRLGEWDKTEYKNLTYLKSGMYWGEKTNGEHVSKSRGFNKDSITRQDVIDALRLERMGEAITLNAEQTRFITAGQALHQDFSKWAKWITTPRKINCGLNGKRIDLLTERPYAEKGDGFMETQGGFHDTEFSYEYPVAWIQGSENMASAEGITFDIARELTMEEMWMLDE